MITEEQYAAAVKQKDEAQKIINAYYNDRNEAFRKRLEDNPIFTDDELRYSARDLCPCGHGLAYPKECGTSHYWDCSAILKGIADSKIAHTGRLPFIYYSIKSESAQNGTTRGVFIPKGKI